MYILKSNKKNMKYYIFSFVLLFFGVFLMENSYAQRSNNVEAEIQVLGNCGMCKDRIERAAYSVRGVRNASWNQEAQTLKLTYRSNRTDQETIERAIAKAGHDSENIITSKEIHANLHHCCIYERNQNWLQNNKQFDEE